MVCNVRTIGASLTFSSYKRGYQSKIHFKKTKSCNGKALSLESTAVMVDAQESSETVMIIITIIKMILIMIIRITSM